MAVLSVLIARQAGAFCSCGSIQWGSCCRWSSLDVRLALEVAGDVLGTAVLLAAFTPAGALVAAAHTLVVDLRAEATNCSSMHGLLGHKREMFAAGFTLLSCVWSAGGCAPLCTSSRNALLTGLLHLSAAAMLEAVAVTAKGQLRCSAGVLAPWQCHCPC